MATLSELDVLELKNGVDAETTVENVMQRLLILGGEVGQRIINDLIHDHAQVRELMKDYHDRYEQEQAAVPILERDLTVKGSLRKVNNKLANDYFGDIIDTKQGYMGSEITVALQKDKLDSEAQIDAATEMLSMFRVASDTEDLNSELVKMAAITGLGCRLLFVNRDGDAEIINVDPWEVIFVYDRSIYKPQFAMRYYSQTVQEQRPDGSFQTEQVWRVEWYDFKNVTFFVQDTSGQFHLDETEPKNPMPHMFDGIPLIAFPNNQEMTSDGKKVLELIDGYDRTLSDVNSEIEQLRLAYMFVIGMGLDVDQDMLDAMKQSGIVPLEEGGSIGFAEKALDDGVIEHHLDRLDRNIMRFAKSVDFTSDQFAGDTRVIAHRIRLSGLEWKCENTERKFRRALREQYRMLTDYWRLKGAADIDPMALEYIFTRSFPMNLKEEAETLGLLKGMVSDQTAFGQMSFIDDPDQEIDQLNAEAEGAAVIDEDAEDEEEAPLTAASLVETMTRLGGPPAEGNGQ